MNRFKSDYSSRFRILKGGKISLVVSALLLSSSVMVTNANALDIVATTGTAPVVTNNNGATQSINVVGDVTINNAQALDLQDMGNATFTVNSGVTVTSTSADTAAALYFNGTDLNNTTITNSGTLEATGSSYSLGMRIFAVALNNSTILNAENATITASSSGNKAFGIEIGDPIMSSTIENAGDMNVTSTSSAATGISLGNITLSSVTNSGTLDVLGSSAVGINATVFGDSNITNSGSITVNATSMTSGSYGIRLNNSNADNTTITNSGVITVISKDGGKGIYVGGTTYGLKVTNSGTINLDGVEGWFSGIEINSALLDSGTREAIITNSGTISANVTDGAITLNIGIDILGDINDASQVINDANGLISLTNDSVSNLFGIRMNADMHDTSSITNAGTISINSGEDGFGIYGHVMYDNTSVTNTNVITVDAVGIGYGIKIDEIMKNTSSITNAGTITVDAGEARGIKINTMADNTSVLNSGTIDVSAVGQATGIEVQGMMLDGESPLSSISNSGTITVDGFSSAGIFVNSTYDYNASKQFNITNSGTITATVNGEPDWYGFALIGGENTALNVTNTGVINGNIHLTNYSTLTNAGTISLPYNANSDAGYDTFVGTFVNSGTLTIGLLTDGTIENTIHSQLATTDATFDDGSTIRVNVLAASTGVDLLVGETLENVVSASNSLTINGTLNVTDNSALLDFEYVEDEETIDLNIIQAQTVEEAVTSYTDDTVAGGGATPAKAAARALDTIQASIGSHPAMVAVFAELNTLPTNAAVAAAVESTTPQTNGATVGATTQIANGIQGIVEQRQSVNLGMSSGDGMFSDKNFWMKPFGSIAEQNSKDGINGFDVKAGGIGFGIDGDYKDDMRAGFAFFYTQASVDVKDINQNADLDVFTTLAYGSSPIIDNKTKLLYQAGYSWQKTQTDRAVFTGDSAKADYTTTTASLDLKVLRDMRINDSLTLQPLAQVTYRHFDSPDYAESGAGALNLHVDGFTSNQLIVGAGMIGHYKLDESSKLIANLNTGYDTRDEAQSVTSSYEGAIGVEFDTVGIDNGRWNYEAGVGYEKDISKTTNINFSYNYQATGSDFANHTVSAKYVLKF